LSYNIAPYPKSNTSQPYNLYASSSTTVSNWYRDAIDIANNYDVTNKDILVNTIPSYILDDPGNYLPYTVFVNMIGQYFDNIWVYIDNLTDVWDNNNNLNEGISQDLVYDWLKSFGMKLYNSQGNQDVLNYNVGGFSGSVDFTTNCISYTFTNITSVAQVQNFIQCDGTPNTVSLAPFFGTATVCALSGSFAPLTPGVKRTVVGPCYDGNYSPSSSFLNNIPRKELVIDTYKRLYHNLPYLFKGKGAHGGLQGLITLFGITGSILPIKEYGGTNDYQDLKGYSPNKISLGSNNLTGSILSPIKRFETSTTSSREVKSQDLHFIDVSFSPQTQIDNSVSASITAVDPNWVIDNYIAYPEALYLDTYPSLSFQRDYWFGQTFTHPSEGFDYNGFIRLIQFFDNSLFKMVKDFTPARSNTWTGVSIKSPVLERPKVPEAKPLFTNFSDLEGEVTGAAILPVYDPYYFELTGDREPYYTGDITGSILDTYAQFEELNVNPYLVNNTANYVAPGSKLFVLDPQCRQYRFRNTSAVSTRSETYLDCSGSSQTVTLTPLSSATICAISGSYLPLSAGLTVIDLGICPTGNYISSGDMDFILNYTAPYYENFFENSDFNALQNNEFVSLTSEYRKKLIPILSTDSLGRAFTSYSITESVQLQDSYLSDTAYLNSRYDGVQLYGRNFNTWSIGDVSYGLTPVVNYNTKKLGLFTEIINSILPNKSNVTLKYLVDDTGRLVELNQRNRNWAEVQNTFKTGDTLNVSLLNAQQYSNQFATNGNRTIHESGYSYYPILYYFGSSSISPSQNIPFYNPSGDLGIVGTNFFEIYPSGGRFIPPLNYTSSSNGARHEVWDMFNQSSSVGVVGTSWFFIPVSVPPSSFGDSFYTGSGPGVVDINGANVTSSYYIIPSEGAYDFYHNFDVRVAGDVGATFTGSMEIWVSSSITGQFNMSSSVTQAVKIEPQVWNALLGPQTFIINSGMLLQDTGQSVTIYNGFIVNEYNGTSATCGQSPTTTFTSPSDVVYKLYRYGAVSEFWMKSTQSITGNAWTFPAAKKYKSLTLCDAKPVPTLKYVTNFLVDTSLPSYQPGDKIVFRYFCQTTSVGTNKIESASLSPYLESSIVADNWAWVFTIPIYSPGVLKVTPSNGSQIATASICTDQINNTFELGSTLSSFYNPNYYFDPLNTTYSASYSPLYQEYGYIAYPFQLEPFDKILIQIESSNGLTFEYNVSQVAIDGNGLVNILIQEDINGYFTNNSCSKFYKIVFLRRVPDETNIILNLVKPPGKTSYGFVIPQNLSPNVLNNIDDITKNIKLQLLDNLNN